MALKFLYPEKNDREIKSQVLTEYENSGIRNIFVIHENDCKIYLRLIGSEKTEFGFSFFRDSVFFCAEERIRNIEKQDISKVPALEKALTDFFISIGGRLPRRF